MRARHKKFSWNFSRGFTSCSAQSQVFVIVYRHISMIIRHNYSKGTENSEIFSQR